MPKILWNSLGEYNKSCSAPHQKSRKIEFAFFRIFYDFLEILQTSAKTATLFKIQFCEQAPEKNSDPAIGSLGAGSGEDRRNPAKGGTKSTSEGRGSAQGLTYDRFRGLDGPEGVPARVLAGGLRWRPPRAVLRCRSGSDWARRATSSCPRGSRLGLCATLGRGWLGKGSSLWRCPWRTVARGVREDGRQPLL
jgi:hypothetical protein